MGGIGVWVDLRGLFYHVAHVNGRTSAMTLGYDLGLGTSTQVSALVYQSVKSMWDLKKEHW